MNYAQLLLDIESYINTYRINENDTAKIITEFHYINDIDLKEDSEKKLNDLKNIIIRYSKKEDGSTNLIEAKYFDEDNAIYNKCKDIFDDKKRMIILQEYL